MPGREARPGSFLGRARELERLEAGMAELAAGAGSAFALVGEAGIGKTRLTHELAATARERGFEVWFARCTDLDGAPAFWPWIEVLREIEREGCDDPARGAELRALLGVLQGHGPAPSAEAESVEEDEARFALFDAVIRTIASTARQRPLVLVLDDFHWADADSILLLRELARRRERIACMTLVAYRDAPAEPRRAHALRRFEREARVLPLGGLEPEHAAILVEYTTGLAPSARRLAQLVERTGGNPFFLGELAAAPEDGPVPPSIQLALGARLGALSAEAQVVLRCASVLGQRFETGLLAPLVASSAHSLPTLLEEITHAGLLTPIDAERTRFDFSHSLVGEVAYSMLGATERSRLHECVAEHLEKNGASQTEADCARLAQHWSRCTRDDAAGRAVEYATRAARAARSELAPHRVVDHLNLALRAQTRLGLARRDVRERRLWLCLHLGAAHTRLGERSAAREAFASATELARALDDAHALARAAAGWIETIEVQFASDPEALDRLEEALTQLPATDPFRIGLLALKVQLLWHAHREAECEPVARESLALSETSEVDEPRRVLAWSTLHEAIRFPERHAERLELSRRIVAGAALGHSRTVEYVARRGLVVDLLEGGHVADAQLEIERARRIGDTLRHPGHRWPRASERAMIALLTGDFDEAERAITDVRRIGGERQSRAAELAFGVQLFRLREHQGRLGEIVGVLQARAADTGARSAVDALLPLAYCETGQLERARAAFERLAANDFKDVPRDHNWLPFLVTVARVAAAVNDLGRARSLHELLEPHDGLHVISGYGQYWSGAVARYLALLEATLGDARAGPHFDVAIESHRGAGARPLLAQTLLEYGSWKRNQDAEGARVALEESRALFVELAVEPFAGRAADALATLGPAARRAARVSASARPTARLERQGERWRVWFAGQEAFLEDRKGVHDLAILLRTPGSEVHVLDLVARMPTAGAQSDVAPPGSGPSGDALLDADARASYRARCEELREALAAADAHNDAAGCETRRSELEWLEAELVHAARSRETGEFVERARKTVYNRLQTAIRSLERAHPELGRHLRHGVRTGTTCSYQPESRQDWEVQSD